MEPTPESVTRTLRLDRDLDRAIAAAATKQRVSVNFLVNRCIRKYVEWDGPSQEFGVVVIPKLLLDALAKEADAETFERYGREVARDYVRPAAIYLTGEFTVASSIEVLRRGAVYGGSFRFDVDEGRDSRHRVIVLRHDQGRLWSRYFAGLLDETFKILLSEETNVICTDSLCVAQMTLH
jgi:hypothetical protein